MQPDSTKCNILSVSYPLFDKQPVLNDSLKNILLAIFPIEHSSSSLDAQADQFLKEYEAFKKEPYAAGRQYVLQGSVKILTHTPSFVALQANAYIYIGGAHGSSIARYVNYAITEKRVIKLDDVLRPGYKDSLTKVAEAIFRKNEGLSAESSLTDGYFFTDDKFNLNDNYAFTAKGINFLYNQYEIKPFVAGKTELLIPYNTIMELLKPGGTLAQFVK